MHPSSATSAAQRWLEVLATFEVDGHPYAPFLRDELARIAVVAGPPRSQERTQQPQDRWLEALERAIETSDDAGEPWASLLGRVEAAYESWFGTLPAIEPEWPEGREPERAAIVVPGVYVDLFRREVADERELHFGFSQTPGEDEDGESARIVWSFDEILSQRQPDVGSDDVEVLVPVHRDGSGALARWLRNDDCSPFPPDRATAGLRATTAEERRSGIAIARAWLDVLDQLDGLNARVAA